MLSDVYYTIITLETINGAPQWAAQFGDYDRDVVEDEMQGSYCDYEPNQIRIIATETNQDAINAHIAKLNGPTDVSRHQQTMILCLSDEREETDLEDLADSPGLIDAAMDYEELIFNETACIAQPADVAMWLHYLAEAMIGQLGATVNRPLCMAEDHFVRELYPLAGMVCAEVDRCFILAGDAPGVAVYDLCEPLGAAILKQASHDHPLQTLPSLDDMLPEVRRIVADYFELDK